MSVHMPIVCWIFATFVNCILHNSCVLLNFLYLFLEIRTASHGARRMLERQTERMLERFVNVKQVLESNLLGIGNSYWSDLQRYTEFILVRFYTETLTLIPLKGRGV